MEQKFDENPHPCVGVMYPAFLNDVEPATGRDLPPDGLTQEEIESMVVLRTKCEIPPGTMPIPKEGTVGYVKVEKRNYERKLEPKLFEVDLQCWETVG